MSESFVSIDTSLQLHALSFLAASDLSRVASTCKHMLPTAMDELLWKDVYAQRYRDSSTTAPASGCWRQECINKRRELEYTRALTYGRLGRTLTSPKVVTRYSYLEAPVLCGTSKSVAAEYSPLPEMTDEQARAHRSVRQGTCTWSALTPQVQ
jgi:hypothetical protein